MTTVTTTEPAAAKPVLPPAMVPADSVTEGSVTVGGARIPYRAVAGTITVGASDAQDATLQWNGKLTSDAGVEEAPKPEDRQPTAQMFYTAYFRSDVKDTATRPVIFIYNGGPGSPTMYLHLGAFGPKHIVLGDLEHPVGGPYRMADNPNSLLDASDLVFIDAPGAGYSRVHGKDAMKAFYGVDEDGRAFARFIKKWLSKHDRWGSPRYIFGESYGTTRSAVLANMLGDVDLNGVILLSQILNFSISADGPEGNPGTDEAYFLSLPSFAATALFHHKIQAGGGLDALLPEVEQFALNDYAAALHQGADLSADRKQAIATKLAGYTGIPAATWVKANLRLSGGQFSGLLLTDASDNAGRLDTRYSGPKLDPLASEADDDPFMSATGPAFVNNMNQYAHNDLKFGADLTYKPSAREPGFHWNMGHHSPIGGGWEGSLNVMPDLAVAMERSPRMHVLLMGGYYDLGTTFFGATYEMKHLPMPAKLQSNIAYHWFQTGHMVYVNPDAAKELHDTTANFIRANQGH
ncbi:peptidase S10 [Terriglobus aquaticus]